ncbi:hypothetical protein F4X73_16330 [Candidatus Poribacteria bacterium]|nr:hypothetical protein [Candidatus Poribacteria bacterium]MYB66253.1 hypothetical protein [Candidatus Poribacteria bacterium]MYF56038.1 hypothetical protein [Candidatus Poribacteria bacterium]
MTKQISLSLLCIAILLLICTSMYSAAQLTQLNNVQSYLFSQTPQEADKEMDETKLKGLQTRADQKKMMPEKDDGKKKKEYKDENAISVLNPSDFYKSQENRIYSGPQPGEKLPPLMVTHLYERKDRLHKDKAFDITAGVGGKPLILFLQDNNIACIKGMDVNVEVLSKINQFLKRDTIVDESEIANQELQIGIVYFLGDDDRLPDWSDQFLGDLVSDNIKVAKSPDGREGPGSYGLNRNVSQTVLIAKDGKVLHNFAFTQASFYTDPHVLGGVAEALDVEPTALENLLNKQREIKKKEELQKYQEKVTDLNEKLDALKKRYIAESYKAIREAVSNEKISKNAAAERLKKLGITWQEGEALLKDNNAETLATRRAMANRQQRRKVEVKNPDEFKQNREKTIFSGPQPKEKLPSLKAIAINGDAKGKTIDFIAKADKKPLVLIFQDEKPLGLRGLVGFTRLIAQINSKSKQQISVHVLFLGDSPDTLTQQASRIVPHIPDNILLGVSPDGREEPGNYGLNRNVAQTILTVKDGKVLHNFALAQPMLSPDPYVLGGVAELIGQKPATVQEWLNPKNPIIQIKNPAEGEKIGRMLLNGTVVQFDKLPTFLRNLPEEHKSMLLIQAERDVSHEQIVKVMDIAKETGIDKIGFGIQEAENKRMESDSEQMNRDDK